MKYSLQIFFILFLGACFSLQGQQCDAFPYMQEGRTFVSNNLDKKGKIESVATCTVTSVNSTVDGYEAAMSVQVQDPKGNDLMVIPYSVSCDADGMYFDMSNQFNQELLAPLGDVQMNTDKNLLRIPKDIAVGDELPDGKVTASFAEGAMNIKVSLTERKVLAKEAITIDGTDYECFKISYVNLSEMGFMKIKTNVIEWWSDDLLMVKSEMYNKKGKLTSTTEMIKIN